MKIKIICLITLLTLFTTPCFADWPITFVRISCIPEANYFDFEEWTIFKKTVFEGVKYGDEIGRKKRLVKWQKNGYYEVSDLSYKCKLSETTYTLKTKQNPSGGHCKAPGQIILNLYKDNKQIISNVTFGNSGEPWCPTGTTLKGAMAQNHGLYLLRMSKNSDTLLKYKWLLSPKEMRTVITPSILNEYAK